MPGRLPEHPEDVVAHEASDRGLQLEGLGLLYTRLSLLRAWDLGTGV